MLKFKAFGVIVWKVNLVWIDLAKQRCWKLGGVTSVQACFAERIVCCEGEVGLRIATVKYLTFTTFVDFKILINKYAITQ